MYVRCSSPHCDRDDAPGPSPAGAMESLKNLSRGYGRKLKHHSRGVEGRNGWRKKIERDFLIGNSGSDRVRIKDVRGKIGRQDWRWVWKSKSRRSWGFKALEVGTSL